MPYALSYVRARPDKKRLRSVQSAQGIYMCYGPLIYAVFPYTSESRARTSGRARYITYARPIARNYERTFFTRARRSGEVALARDCFLTRVVGVVALSLWLMGEERIRARFLDPRRCWKMIGRDWLAVFP